MDVLFWSGGKDAFLAYEFFRRAYPVRDLSLLTTYNKQTEIVPHQNIAIENIKQQAEALDLNLILIPLPGESSNQVYLKNVDETLKNQKEPIDYLVFGDWYLQDIREWREAQFVKRGYRCLFPIWKKNLNELLPILLLKPVKVKISAVAGGFEKYIQVGEAFNQHFVQQLPKEIDPMGEKGAFHTEVIFKSWEDEYQPANQPL